MNGRSLTPWLIMAPALAGVIASCTTVPGVSTPATTSSTSGGTGGGGGEGGGGPAPQTGRELFDADLKALMLQECGACHQLGGSSDAPFLAAPDIYVSITSWPGVVVGNPAQSILVSHPADPGHGGGQAPDMSPELRSKSLVWLAKEAKDIPKPKDSTKPYIVPFKPFLKGAFNTVYLDPLGKAFESTSISFNAEELGSPPSMLLLTHLAVHPVADVTLHMVHPLFTVYPQKGGELPDPVDSFSNFDQSFSIDGDPTLGTGTLVLTNWTKDARINVAFEALEAKGKSGDIVNCNKLEQFQSEVVPHLKFCADTCHGGTKTEAQATMDLSELAAMPPEAACIHVRTHIVPGDPESSPIVIVTDPTAPAVHMYKFVGNKNKYAAFKQAVSPWIMDEK